MSCIFKDDGFTCLDKKMSYTCTFCENNSLPSQDYSIKDQVKFRAYMEIINGSGLDINNNGHIELVKHVQSSDIYKNGFWGGNTNY